MTGRERRALADALRALPLGEVAAALGYRRDPRDRARWKRDGSVLSITGERFFDHLRGIGGGGAIDLAIHARQRGFRDALRFLPGPRHAPVVSTAGVRTSVPQWLEAFGLRRIDCGFDADDAGDRAAHAARTRAGNPKAPAGKQGVRIEPGPDADVRQCRKSAGRNTQNHTIQSGKSATDQSEIQHLDRMSLRCGLIAPVMMAMALGHVRAGRPEMMRSLVRVPIPEAA